MADTKPRGMTPQAALVLDYLTAGRTLTSLIAMTTLGVANVTTRIAELRKLGYKISGVWDVDHFNRRYMKYTLDGTSAEA